MFATSLVFLILLGVHGLAMPIPFDRATSEPSQPPPSCNQRTLFNVTWNCLSTTIICAWVSVHPNVPPSGLWRALRRRLMMMIWTIIAPELVLAWAVRQWFAAKEIRDTVNGTSEGALEANDDQGLFKGLVMTVKEWFAKENMTGQAYLI